MALALHLHCIVIVDVDARRRPEVRNLASSSLPKGATKARGQSATRGVAPTELLTNPSTITTRLRHRRGHEKAIWYKELNRGDRGSDYAATLIGLFVS